MRFRMSGGGRVLSRALILSAILYCVQAYSQNPKVYWQMDIIDRVVPLQHGFVVYIKDEIRATQLDIDNMPTVFVTAIPLEEHSPSWRDIHYKLKKNHVQMKDLRSNSWHFVCVEFENQHREQRKGNFSTDCKIHRTLDKYGTPNLNMTRFLRWVSLGDTKLEAQVEVDVTFPTEVQFYLENYPLVHSYMMSQRKSLTLSFNHLEPDTNYGEICAIAQPLLTAYTGMGRTIRQSLKTCFPGSAQKTLPANTKNFQSDALRAQPQSRRSVSETSGANYWTRSTLCLSVIICLCAVL